MGVGARIQYSVPRMGANSNDKKKFYMISFSDRERRGGCLSSLFSFFLLWLAPGKEKPNIDGMASCVGVLGVKKGERRRISILFCFFPHSKERYI